MKYTVSYNKIFKILEWILLIGFTILAGWFASGVLEQYFSHRTSFSQYEKEITDYPVISMVFLNRPALEVNLTNVIINYYTIGMKTNQTLEIGENYFHNDEYNKTQKVILECLETSVGNRAFRIIHTTPILGKKGPRVQILNMFTKFEEQPSPFSDLVFFYLTSLENSPGFAYTKWKDGKPLQITINKNNIVGYNVQPQLTKYLKQTGKCQEESYYECIASQFDANEFIKCPKKCIPNVFSNLDKNYSSLFCQNDTYNEKCFNNYIWQQEAGSNCKRSCSNLEYFGEFEAIVPYQSEKDNWSFYQMHYFIDTEFAMKVYDEYIIVDAIGMIGSVGGTLGLFIGFSFTNAFNVIIGYLQLFLNKICWKNSAITDQEMSKIKLGNLTEDAKYQHKLYMMEIKLSKMQKAINDLKPTDEVKEVRMKEFMGRKVKKDAEAK